MKMKHITRPLKIKAADENGHFEGYGSVFDVVDSYRDIILPGAFEKTIQWHKDRGEAPKLLWQHHADQPIGIWSQFDEDDTGLKLAGELLVDDVRQASEAYALLKAGALSGLSIGFTVPKGGEEYDKERNVWLIREVELWETSIVTFPANRDAVVTDVKNTIESGELPTVRDFETFLMRDAGFSRTQARIIINEGYKNLATQDASEAEIVAAIDKLLRGYG